MEVRGRRATVMGLGRHGGGVAAARWLVGEGAVVTVTDLADAAALADSIAALADVDIADWHLGSHRDSDLDSADLVVVNPAVRPGNPLVARAAARGASITSEVELFLERCPGRVVGVTGSNGKSTTASMIAEILRADGRLTFLGGNIGHSLLADLDAMRHDSWAVVEISSFQLAWLSPDCLLPAVAVLTNFAPNHLDWHGTLAAYAAAKMRLLSGQRPCDTAVLGEGCHAHCGTPQWARSVELPRIHADGHHAQHGRCASVPLDLAPADHLMPIGPAQIAPHWTAAVRGRLVEPFTDAQIPELNVPGAHNRRNASCAAAAARSIGCSSAAIDSGLQGFRGLAHRLELVGLLEGREFYNDSMATTPESAAAALETFSGRSWLLAGGYDKGIDMSPLVVAIARHALGTAFYGAIGPRLHAQLAAMDVDCPVALFESLDCALPWCWRQSQRGDCVLLSPACASYDQFVDYRARGERFRSLVRALGAAR